MNRSDTTWRPARKAGATISKTCCALSAAIISASAAGSMSVPSGSNKMRRSSAPNAVAPNWKVASAPILAASSLAWVDLPAASMPSRAIRRPLWGVLRLMVQRS